MPRAVLTNDFEEVAGYRRRSLAEEKIDCFGPLGGGQ